MSGNFDFPPASSSSSSASPAPTGNVSLPAPLVQLRDALERERERDRAARDSAASERQNIHVEVPMPPRRHRGEPRRRRPPVGDRDARDRNNASRMPPSPSLTSSYRPRAVPGERYQSLRRHRLQREQLNDGIAAFDEASNRLVEVNNDLANLLAPGALSPSRTNRRSPPADLEASRRRNKRRKLEHENAALPFESFKYGHFGQVVPGRLKMEIVSCDGGEYVENPSQALYKPENVLKNDKSVYCTKSSRCNLLLKHQGETTFCLEKVVIKAPARGFTAPVQEGMIFVSMSSNELLNGTAKYHIEYSSPSPRHSSDSPPSSHDEEQLSLAESLTDPDIWATTRLGREEAMQNELEQLELEERAMRFARLMVSRRRVHDYYMRTETARDHQPPSTNTTTPEHCEWPLTEPDPPAAGVSAPTPPPFTVTTETDGELSGEDELPSTAVMADRFRRDRRWRADSGDDDDDIGPMNAFWDTPRRRFGSAGYLRAARRSTPSRIEPKGTVPETDDYIAPNARFFIAKHKNKITVKFDPPVSGKFILLKLWSPQHGGNIDIESVLFHGYSGPRYFPACQMR
ncbi:hypothetical protein K432DRAFT_377605 [Lepidopterella palustris CBS 459.81]|uniref:Uncharacterized protein n=1 Tax=Lepidopterella palustris CBS 459.81 TaxID=1314670 RepID=A0A8E2EL32_9PEZI|nr:hypothetical protein K432DRAFT_377605 [Lepidopterella palustris CBS 459.81]